MMGGDELKLDQSAVADEQDEYECSVEERRSFERIRLIVRSLQVQGST
jgi:hypothetical protein